MASIPDPPYLRSPLHPFVDLWSGGPALLFPVVRFGLLTSWRISAPEQAPAPRAAAVALLAPEMPFSVLPFSIRQASNVLCDTEPAGPWQGRPLPLWRGVPCELGRAWMSLLHPQGAEGLLELPLLVLLPQRDPAGPRPDFVLLGAQFLTHYDLRVTLDYSAVQRFPERAPGQPLLDSSISCGHVEMF